MKARKLRSSSFTICAIQNVVYFCKFFNQHIVTAKEQKRVNTSMIGGATLYQMGTQLPSPKGHSSPNFQLMSVVAKRLDGSRCHLVGK